MKCALVAVLALGIASSALADRKLEETVLIASAVTDIVSTEMLLHSNPGFHELHPLGQSFRQRLLLKSAGTVGVLLFARGIDRWKGKKAGGVVRWSASSVWLGAAGWNVSLMMRF